VARHVTRGVFDSSEDLIFSPEGWSRGDEAHNERLAMSKRGKHEPKWHWHIQPSEQDGTGRRLRALCAHGIMKGHVEDVWSQNCETLQLGRDFLYTSKEPKVGQRIEINCTAPSNKYFRMNGVLTSVDNVPPPPGVLPPIMPNCHHMEDHTYDLHFEEFGNTHFFAKANGTNTHTLASISPSNIPHVIRRLGGALVRFLARYGQSGEHERRGRASHVPKFRLRRRVDVRLDQRPELAPHRHAQGKLRGMREARRARLAVETPRAR
jgi:hypothetical protein